MACKYQHWIVPYLDGQIAASGEEELKTHIKGCSSCMEDFQVHKKLDQVLRSLDIVAGVHERLAGDPRWREAFKEQPRRTFLRGTASKKRTFEIDNKGKLPEEKKPTEQE